MNKSQKLPLRDVIEGAQVVIRLAKEDKSGDPRIGWQFGRMQRKINGAIGDGSPFEHARNQLMKTYGTLVKVKTPEGIEVERRVLDTEEKMKQFDDSIKVLVSEEVEMPIGFLDPNSLHALKLDRPMSGAEMAVALWVFDADALEKFENEIDAGMTSTPPAPALDAGKPVSP